MDPSHRIAWFELPAEDPGRTARFYAEVFGWEVAPLDAPAPRNLIDHAWVPGPVEVELDDLHLTHRGRPIAGVSSWYSVGREPRPPGWTPYIISRDLKALAERIVAESPRYQHSIHACPRLGRFLPFHDMEGASITAFTPTSDHPSRGLPAEGPGTFCWAELQAVHDEAQEQLYGRLFGWELARTESHGTPYTYFKSGKGATAMDIAGVWLRPDWRHGSSCWLPYVEVSSLDDTAATIGRIGGSCWVEPTDLGRHKRFGLFRDLEGCPFGAIELV